MNKPYSIYGRIVIIVLIPMLFLTGLLFGVYQVFYAMSVDQAEENFALQTEQYVSNFERRLEDIADMAQSIGYSDSVQKYFARMTSQERVENYKSVRQLFDAVAKTVPGVMAIYVGNHAGVFVESGNGNLRYFQGAYLNRNMWAGESKQAWFTELFTLENSDVPRYCVYYAPVGIITPISMMNEADVLTCGVLIDLGQLLPVRDGASQGIMEVLESQGQIIASSAPLSQQETEALERSMTSGEMEERPLIRVGQEDYLFSAVSLSSLNGLGYGTDALCRYPS